MGRWGIVKLGGGGKLDGKGYGGTIHDNHGPECCGTSLWIEVVGDRRAEAVKKFEKKVRGMAWRRGRRTPVKKSKKVTVAPKVTPAVKKNTPNSKKAAKSMAAYIKY